jgi:hypothetical protein
MGEERGIKNTSPGMPRLRFSILLQDENVDNATVALLLGHTSTKYVNTVGCGTNSRAEGLRHC